MTRELPKEDAGDEYIQFRGPQSSVTHERTGVHFGTEVKEVVHGGEDRHLRVHRAYPVVDVDADPDDVPEDAIARPVAEQIVESNPLVCWGVACEWPEDDPVGGAVCGQVFETPRGMASHQGSVHNGQSDSSTEDDGGED